MAKEKEINWISGFWRRVGAFAIDSVVLGVFGLGIGFLFEETFVALGAWGRLLGFIIAFIYFGVLNSVIANGQTIGKKATKIRVVDSNNKPISILRSSGRYCFFGIPFFLNGAQLPNEAFSSFWIYVFSIVIFGGASSIIYLYIFNRATRQSLHDLIVGTYVVNLTAEKKDTSKIWGPHLIFVSLLLITSAVVPVVTSHMAEQPEFVGIMKTREALMEHSSVVAASVFYGKNTVKMGKNEASETTFVSAQVFLNKNQTSNSKLARELAASIVDNYSQATEKNTIRINLVYGYDIGIASKWYRQTHSFNPNEF